MGISGLTKSDIWQLDNDEATMLAGSVANMLKEFNIEPSPKFVALMGLASAASLVYGPRIYLFKNELSERAKEKKSKKSEADPLNGMSTWTETQGLAGSA